MKPILRWLYKHSGKTKYGILGLCISNSIMAVCTVVSALVFKRAVDGAIDGDSRKFILYLGLCAGIFLFQNLLSAFGYYMNEITGYGLEKRLKGILYKKLLTAQYRELSGWHTGELMNHLSEDVDIVISGMLNILPGITGMVTKLLGAACALMLLEWRFCVVLLLGGTVIAAAAAAARKIMQRLHRNVREGYDSIYAFIQETVEGIVMVRTFCAENRAENILKAKMKRLGRRRLKRSLFYNGCSFGLECMMDFGYLLGFLWCGLGILRGEITLGTLSAVLHLIDQIQQPFSNAGSYLSQYYALSASAERLMKLDKMPEEERPDDRREAFSGDRLQCIRIQKLSFSYEGTSVFQNADLLIHRKEIIGFTGVSGIGKSTLFKLLLALYPPDSGTLLLENSQGIKLCISPALRSMFSYIPQGNYLFSGTIYECIHILSDKTGFSETEKKRIEEACKIACADEFIQELPQKYETIIGEHGSGISEGQAQRLAIARALYTNAPILLMDEATSALDEATEEKVLENIFRLTEKTVLLVTHGKRALSICSRVIRIENGAFVEERTNDRI